MGRTLKLLGVIALILAAGSGHSIAQTVIRFSHELPISHNLHKGTQMLSETVARRSNGALKIEVYPAGQLTKDGTFIKSITSGTVDAGLNSPSWWSGVMPLAGVFDVPFVITNHKDLQRVLAGPVGARFLKDLGRFDLVGLGYFNYGFGVYGNNKRPLNTPADFKGLKIRTTNDIGAKLVQVFGASPAQLSGSEVFMALERGTVDGAHLGITSVVERKLYETVKHLTIDNHNALQYFVVVRRAVFDKLTPEQQDILRDAVRESSEWVTAAQEKDDLAAAETLKEKGMQLVELTPAQIKVWKEAAKEVRDYWLSRVGSEGAAVLKEIEDTIGR